MKYEGGFLRYLLIRLKPANLRFRFVMCVSCTRTPPQISVGSKQGFYPCCSFYLFGSNDPFSQDNKRRLCYIEYGGFQAYSTVPTVECRQSVSKILKDMNRPCRAGPTGTISTWCCERACFLNQLKGDFMIEHTDGNRGSTAGNHIGQVW